MPLLTPSHAAQLSLESLRGKIVYRTDRDVNAVQLYVMEADGSNPRLCDCSDVYQAVLKKETDVAGRKTVPVFKGRRRQPA